MMEWRKGHKNWCALATIHFLLLIGIFVGSNFQSTSLPCNLHKNLVAFIIFRRLINRPLALIV